MSYAAKVLLDSLAPNGRRLTTLELTFPRFVLAEFNTHRAFSRNSASSRAIPVERLIRRAQEHPYVPERFPRNARGMQPSAYYEVSSPEHRAATRTWLRARDAAVLAAQELVGLSLVGSKHDVDRVTRLDVHKQVANRLLEPFLWHTVLVTATEWYNFFHLRCHGAAQEQLRNAVLLARQAYEASEPRPLREGEYHLPLWSWDLDGSAFLDLAREEGWSAHEQDYYLRVIVSARCARVSYLTHDGRRDLRDDLRLGRDLLVPDPLDPDSPVHASPFEHVAAALGSDDGDTWSGNVRGFRQFRKELPRENVDTPLYEARGDV